MFDKTASYFEYRFNKNTLLQCVCFSDFAGWDTKDRGYERGKKAHKMEKTLTVFFHMFNTSV